MCNKWGGSPQSTLNIKRRATKRISVSYYAVFRDIFHVNKNNNNFKGIKMFESTFLHTAYADDSTFFLKDKN